MRPSHYNYLKRMWTREMCRKSAKKKVQKTTPLKKPSLFPTTLSFTIWTMYFLFNFNNGIDEVGFFPMISIYLFGIILFVFPFYILYKRKAKFFFKSNNVINNTVKSNKRKPVPQKKDNKKNEKSKLSYYELERYAIMCNAHLEHEDEMEKYNQ